MALTRDLIPSRVSALLDGRPTRWVPADRLIGDYDGSDRTLEVFDAHACEQRSLLRQLRPQRHEIERQVGGALIVVFHTPGETRRLYPDVQCIRRGRGARIALDFLRLPPESQLPSLDQPSSAEHMPDPIVADPPYEEAA